jgi:hypothetical protein
MDNPNPNYVLKANELVWGPKKNSALWSCLKKAVYVILAVLIFGSFLMGENLFAELSLLAKVLLIALCVKVLFTSTTQRVPKPFELRFYDDYLVLYRADQYYTPKDSRMEFFKFRYEEIDKIEFRTGTQRLNISGTVEGKMFTYKKDGSLPEKPSYHRVTKGGIAYFYTGAAPEVDFVAEIEKHTPIKVLIKDS